jgi:hypothetical protein
VAGAGAGSFADAIGLKLGDTRLGAVGPNLCYGLRSLLLKFSLYSGGARNAGPSLGLRACPSFYHFGYC